ncbi:hypothetical protein ABTY61_03755 [Kitasatospora sp. NPDC096128]
MTDTLSRLAEPQPIAYGGHSALLARGPEPAERELPAVLLEAA